MRLDDTVTLPSGVFRPPWLVDVVPRTCFANLLLFVSVQPHPYDLAAATFPDDNEFGVWLARALPSGLLLPGERDTMFGVDFVSGWPDLVLQDSTATVDGVEVLYVYKDPDPRMAFGGWRVYAGGVYQVNNSTTGDSQTFGTLDYADGDTNCFPYTDGLDTAESDEDETFLLPTDDGGQEPIRLRRARPVREKEEQGSAPFPLDHPSAPVRPDPLPGLHARALPLPSVLSQRDTAFEAFHQRVTAHAVQG